MAKRDKGVGPYAGVGDLRVRRDSTVDDSGNPIVRSRQIVNMDDDTNSDQPGGNRTVNVARFGGGAMVRQIPSAKVKRHDGF